MTIKDCCLLLQRPLVLVIFRCDKRFVDASDRVLATQDTARVISMTGLLFFLKKK
jgi:hypothetical protein